MLNWLMGQKKPDEGAVAESVATPEPSDASVVTPAQQAAPLTLRKECAPPAEPSNKQESDLAERVLRRMDECEREIASPGFDLPTLPSVAMRLMELMQNVNAPIGKISETVMNDPVMAAKFLRMANSAMYGGKTKIESVHHAVTRLGLNTVKNVVMSIALNGTIFKDKRLEVTAKKLWEHSIGSAVAAREMAKLLGASQDAAFMAGLLHDIGKVPALLFVQRSMEPNSKIRPEFFDSLVEQHHIRAGIALQSLWNLPTEARLAMAAHHAVQNCSDAEAQTAIRAPQVGAEDRDELRDVLISVVLGDRALASLGMCDEPGDVYIVESPLSGEMGLGTIEAMEYLQGLPEQLKRVEDAV